MIFLIGGEKREIRKIQVNVFEFLGKKESKLEETKSLV